MFSFHCNIILNLCLFIFEINVIFGVPYVGPADQSYFNTQNFSNKRVNDLPQLTCNDMNLFSNTTDVNPVQYYKVNITSTLQKFNSLTISTCCNDSPYCGNKSLDTYLYLFSLKRGKIILLDAVDDINTANSALLCENHEKSIFDITSYVEGQYIVGVGGFDKEFGNFHIELNCIGSEEISSSVGYLIFVVIGIFLIGFGIFYYHETKKYHGQNSKSISNGQTISYSNGTETDNIVTTINIAELQHTDQVETDDDDDDDDDDDNNDNHEVISSNTVRRVLGGDETREDLVEQKEDIILALLGHVEASCNDEHGLDIYQVLAIRAMDIGSNEPNLVRPFKTIGWNIQCIKISDYHKSLFIAIITILLQTMGITVVVYKLITSYFQHQNNVKCSMDTARWTEVYSLKILSFLWSLVISFSIGTQLGNVRRNGVYRMVTELEDKEIGSITYINFWWIRIGQILNYYACLLSVIGSFFIIFETNSDDYSHSGLDMVLNAVALFFMLELDDCLVSYQDFRDTEHIIHKHFVNRGKYVDSMHNKNKMEMDHQQITNEDFCKIKYCGKCTEFVAFFVKFWLYIFGVFAPIAMLLCY